MKKTLLFCSLFAIAAFNFMSCDDEDENNNTTNNGGGTTTSNLSAEFVGASDCLGSPYDTEGTRADGENNQIVTPFINYKFDSAKGELELTLENLVLNCAAIPKMDIRFSGDTIIFNAYNANPEFAAKCLCTYNLTSKVKGAESKVYYIRPEKLTDVEDIQVLELSQKSEGVVYFSNATSSY